MNIFHSLTQGYGRLTETNLSAFLRFLLSPHEAHGFSDLVLRRFLEAVAISTGQEHRFDDALRSDVVDARVALEVMYPGANGQRIDLEIEVFDGAGEQQRKLHHIVVENKVKAASAQTDQLARQFESVSQAMSEEEPAPITMVFLTPPGNDERLLRQFAGLSLDAASANRKAWLRWHGAQDHEETIVSILRRVLALEAQAQIEPITDYMRHTLKAFTMFLERNVEMSHQKRMARSEPGSIVGQAIVTIGERTYTIIRTADGVVQILDEAEAEVRAYPILRQVNDTYGLGLSLTGSTGNKINTQLLGRRVLARLAEPSSNT